MDDYSSSIPIPAGTSGRSVRTRNLVVKSTVVRADENFSDDEEVQFGVAEFSNDGTQVSDSFR